MSRPEDTPPAGDPGEQRADLPGWFGVLVRDADAWEQRERQAESEAAAFRGEAEREIEERAAPSATTMFVPGSTVPDLSQGAHVAPLPAPPSNVVPFVPPVRATYRWRAVMGAVAAGVLFVLGAVGLWFRPQADTSGENGVKLLLRDGPVRVLADGRLETGAVLPEGLRTAVEGVIRRRSLGVVGDVSGLLRGGDEPGTASADNSSGAGPKLLEPWPGTTVEALRPVLRWQSASSSTEVTLESLTGDGTFRSGPLAEKEGAWQVPAPLERGEIYRWTVRAGAASAEGTFKVLGDVEAGTLARKRKELAGSHLLLAVMYSQAGLQAEAHAESLALAAADPQSKLARDLAKSFGP